MKLSSLAVNVEAYTKARVPRYIEELRAWCAIDSGTDYKLGLDKMAHILAEHFRRLEMEVTLFEQERYGNDVLGVLRGNGTGNVILLGHTDTVYPVGTAAARPLRIENNSVYGPGVCDMKGCILSAIYAIEALLAVGCRSFGELCFLCISDEEISRRHSPDLIREVCQDCHAALVLEAARANGDVVSARKGTAWYMLSAHGRAAHAGVEPEKGHNAILELAHQILQFQSLQGWQEGLTINPGVISGGTVQNVVPDYAQVGLDLRFLSLDDRIATEKRWREMLQKQYIPGIEVTLTLDAYCEPMVCTAQSLRLVYQLQEIAALLGFSVGHMVTGGSSDARYPAALGIPVLDGLGPIGGLDHSPGEYILEDSIAPRTALLASLIATMSERLSEQE
jgi:glutamate carboxypeptidase